MSKGKHVRKVPKKQSPSQAPVTQIDTVAKPKTTRAERTRAFVHDLELAAQRRREEAAEREKAHVAYDTEYTAQRKHNAQAPYSAGLVALETAEFLRVLQKFVPSTEGRWCVNQSRKGNATRQEWRAFQTSGKFFLATDAVKGQRFVMIFDVDRSCNVHIRQSPYVSLSERRQGKEVKPKERRDNGRTLFLGQYHMDRDGTLCIMDRDDPTREVFVCQDDRTFVSLDTKTPIHRELICFFQEPQARHFLFKYETENKRAYQKIGIHDILVKCSQ
jgi:hypothetical protein